jgi:hypothetical protein
MWKVVKPDEKRHFEMWHNIGKPQAVKKSITYREITVAIGIIVAMVIALTLWIRVPKEKVTGSGPAPRTGMHAAAKNLFKTAVEIFSYQGNLR